MSLKDRITEDMKAAMRARESDRLSTVRMLLAAIKQREVDERARAASGEVPVTPIPPTLGTGGGGDPRVTSPGV